MALLLGLRRTTPGSPVLRLLYGIVVLVFCGGLYVLLTALAPNVADISVVSRLAGTSASGYQEKPVGEDRLYIPAIDSTLPIVPIDGNENLALTKGAIHRRPESGSPNTGGNFVLAGHRFVLRWNPIETVRRSPLYNLHKTKLGDDVIVDYAGKRYEYSIVLKKQVKETDITIERPTREHQLTLYSCELSGSESGRDVIIAVLKGGYQMSDGEYVPHYI